MTTKERLHELVDELSEPEAKRALRLVEKEREDPMIAAFRDAPEDDEPWTDEDEAAAAEGRADIAAGRTVSMEEIKREFGLS
jgi:predicted transcriptional regulator